MVSIARRPPIRQSDENGRACHEAGQRVLQFRQGQRNMATNYGQRLRYPAYLTAKQAGYCEQLVENR